MALSEWAGTSRSPLSASVNAMLVATAMGLAGVIIAPEVGSAIFSVPDDAAACVDERRRTPSLRLPGATSKPIDQVAESARIFIDRSPERQ
ncbi:hypothetical protein ACFXPX_16225 [Kitasatospora sp. NPDC059146]|uniref:hypothetical protein n=1 Tax=unclassified Kitasatospora TaxID=2633591 RepID=UPI0036BD88EB